MTKYILTAFVLLIVQLTAQNHLKEVKPLSPEESINSMEIPDGYKLQLVASEPMISEPVLCVWDGNGRMYVAEMNTYMQDADATGEQQATSRVKLLEDTNGDGKMDKATVFADNLLLPRMILPLDNRIIIGTTNTKDMYAYTDTDGDGKADKKELWWQGGSQGGNMEHQPSGLVWNMDNWIYMTYAGKRLRFTRGKLEVESVPNGPSQWGMDHDDRGRIISGFAGIEKSFQTFQQPWRYGIYELEGELTDGFMSVWPIDNIPDTQGGLRRLRSNNTLNHFTAGCGHSIYRDSLIPELQGDLFMCEPVGRLVRRAKVKNKNGLRILENPYKESEFIRSSDPNFRPVNTKMGPDGCLYIVDMYRGIIQQGNWTQKGSYLRKVIDDYGLAANIGRGRIYRLIPKTNQPRTEKPQMLNETPIQLVEHLKHPNGWWRDTARKLIILKGDKSIVNYLLKMLMNSNLKPHSRVAAIWTLEGLDALTPEIITEAMQSQETEVQIAAAQAGESLLKEMDTLLPAYISLLNSAKPDLKTQAFMSIKTYSASTNKTEIFKQYITEAKPETAREQYSRIYLAEEKKKAEEKAEKLKREKENALLAQSFERGKVNYRTLCFACHGKDGKGTPMSGTNTKLGAPLKGSKRVVGNIDRLGRIVLQGLMGPIDGKTYPGVMAAAAAQSDQWLADTLNYMRNEWGNKAVYLSSEDIAAVRQSLTTRETAWTLDELNEKWAKLDTDKHLWDFESSHGTADLSKAIDGDPKTKWRNGSKQQNGMWVKFGFDSAAKLKGLIMTGGKPQKIDVEISLDNKNWEKILHNYAPEGNKILFTGTRNARYIKITISKKRLDIDWRINEMELILD